MKKRTEILTRRIFAGARIFSWWKIPRARADAIASLRRASASTNFLRGAVKGFTLIEPLVAISLLTIAIVAPMTLVTKSLSAAMYARDQVAAFYLAQEGIEAVRAIRDGNILNNAINGTSDDILAFIPGGNLFTVDARFRDANDVIDACAATGCDPLEIIELIPEGTLYGYGSGVPTRFTRTLDATKISNDEIRIDVEVKWRTGAFQERTFTISENMYRWVEDCAAADDDVEGCVI